MPLDNVKKPIVISLLCGAIWSVCAGALAQATESDGAADSPPDGAFDGAEPDTTAPSAMTAPPPPPPPDAESEPQTTSTASPSSDPSEASSSDTNEASKSSRLGSSPLARTEYGLRLGYGIPAGNLYAERPISDWIGGAVEAQFDLEYVLNPSLVGGIYVGIDVPSTSNGLDDGCDAVGHDCSAFGARAGFQGEYRFAPEQFLSPWVGLGAGAEALSISEDGPAIDYSATLVGPELSVSGGLDLGLGSLGLGLYATYRVAWYASVTERYGIYGTGRNDVDSSVHHWFAVGLRGHLAPFSG